MKRVLLQRCCPTLAPGWVGFLAFRESFDPRPAIILASAVLRLGAAAVTNGESRFGRSEQTPAVGQPGRFLSRGEWLESALCSWWLTTRRMGEDTPIATFAASAFRKFLYN